MTHRKTRPASDARVYWRLPAFEPDLVTRLHLALLIGINGLWGFNFIAGKAGTTTFGPLLFITIRFVVVLILLAPCLRLVPGQMRNIVVIGLTLGIGHYAFMFYSLYIAGSVSAIAIAAQLTVPFSTLLAIAFLGERIGLTRAIAIACAFAGVVIIAMAPIGPEHVLALCLTVVASASMAVATIKMRALTGVGVFNLQAWIALCATLALTPLTLILEQPSLATFTSVPLTGYWTPMYSAIGATIVGHSLLYYLLQRYPVNNVAPFITLSTLFAVGFGIWLLGDAMTPRIVLGGLLTLAGVTIVAIRNAPREVLAEEPAPPQRSIEALKSGKAEPGTRRAP